MKLIPLTQGKFAMVDDEDYEWLSKYNWCACVRKTSKWYAQRNVSAGKGKQRALLMHRAILVGVKLVDHWDRDGLNNQRSNLRDGTRGGNSMNSVKTRRITYSRFKGVTFQHGKWKAQAGFNSRECYIGRFTDEESAAHAYDSFARKHFGKFARLNFPSPEETSAGVYRDSAPTKDTLLPLSSTGISDIASDHSSDTESKPPSGNQ